MSGDSRRLLKLKKLQHKRSVINNSKERENVDTAEAQKYVVYAISACRDHYAETGKADIYPGLIIPSFTHASILVDSCHHAQAEIFFSGDLVTANTILLTSAYMWFRDINAWSSLEDEVAATLLTTLLDSGHFRGRDTVLKTAYEADKQILKDIVLASIKSETPTALSVPLFDTVWLSAHPNSARSSIDPVAAAQIRKSMYNSIPAASSWSNESETDWSAFIFNAVMHENNIILLGILWDNFSSETMISTLFRDLAVSGSAKHATIINDASKTQG